MPARSAAKCICRSAGCGKPAMATGKRARRRSTASASGRRSMSITAGVCRKLRLTRMIQRCPMKTVPETQTDSGKALEELYLYLVEDYLARNAVARVLQAKLDETGVGFIPVIDHITIRTMDIDRRAEEFLSLGYTYSETLSYED